MSSQQSRMDPSRQGDIGILTNDRKRSHEDSEDETERTERNATRAPHRPIKTAKSHPNKENVAPADFVKPLSTQSRERPGALRDIVLPRHGSDDQRNKQDRNQASEDNSGPTDGGYGKRDADSKEDDDDEKYAAEDNMVLDEPMIEDDTGGRMGRQHEDSFDDDQW